MDVVTAGQADMCARMQPSAQRFFPYRKASTKRDEVFARDDLRGCLAPKGSRRRRPTHTHTHTRNLNLRVPQPNNGRYAPPPSLYLPFPAFPIPSRLSRRLSCVLSGSLLCTCVLESGAAGDNFCVRQPSARTIKALCPPCAAAEKKGLLAHHSRTSSAIDPPVSTPSPCTLTRTTRHSDSGRANPAV